MNFVQAAATGIGFSSKPLHREPGAAFRLS
jgi:hypothetical protein